MSGKRINQHQVRLYMKARQQSADQTTAAAKSGFSERSGQRIEAGQIAAWEKKERAWRTRKDPFAEVWESEVEAQLKKAPQLSPTTLFEALQEKYPGRHPNSQKRTFQRRVKAWKALHGADKEVIFRQRQEAGRLGLSDFTQLKDIVVTIGGEPFAHLLYHFRLAYSGWRYAKVVLGGESYTALAEGLQEALWRLGGAPGEHRTDSLSAAFKNLKADEQEDQTVRYQALCAHYGMAASRNNRGVSHENGGIESPHGHLKRRIKQGLLLRGSADFATREAYQQWLEGIVKQLNRHCSEALEVERAKLKALPLRRTGAFGEAVVPVTTSSTIEVKRVLYTVPSRLIGERLRLHIFDDRIEAYVGSQRAHTLPRIYPTSPNQRARCVDYRHVIGSLARKPQAFRYSQLRDDLLPNAHYRNIWQYIDRQMEPRAACKQMVGILALAAKANCQQALGEYVWRQFEADHIPSLHALQQRFDPQVLEPVSVLAPEALSLPQHPLSLYTELLAEVH
jgi:transposase InsO family protein